MTSHVAQFIIGDAEWAETLAALRRSLVPGGRLIFDARDPAAQGWLVWNRTDFREHVTLPGGRQVTSWTEVTEVTEVSGELVSFVTHYFANGAPAQEEPHSELQSVSTLRFRSEHMLHSTLTLAGFEIVHIYGGWERQAVGDGDGEFIVVARA